MVGLSLIFFIIIFLNIYFVDVNTKRKDKKPVSREKENINETDSVMSGQTFTFLLLVSNFISQLYEPVLL